MDLTKLPWMNEDKFVELKRARKEFKTYCSKYKNHKNMKKFSTDKSISMVFSSKKLENKLPDEESDTYKNLLTISVDTEHKIAAWKDDDADYNESQLAQHMRAYNYLMPQKELTFDAILKAHGILMLEATNNGLPVLKGKIRTNGANNGEGYDYISPEKVEEELNELVTWYGKIEEDSDPVETAYKLFLKFLRIHPFEDGNGRIARLLVAYHLCFTGTPFPVAITSGRKQSRKDYRNAIMKEDRLCSNRTDLFTLICYSVYLGWKDFFDNESIVEKTQ